MPWENYATVNKYRQARGRILAAQIKALACHLQRPVTVLDVGGRTAYWENVGLTDIAAITILNNDSDELLPDDAPPFTYRIGNGCDLPFEDQSFDLVHSNSVIEHVGLWPQQKAFAAEARRVGHSGWIQTPAFEFPMEPHYHLPFVHWLGQSLRCAILGYVGPFRGDPVAHRREHVDRTSLLTRTEVRALFPGTDIYIERLAGLPKSYTARWGRA